MIVLADRNQININHKRQKMRNRISKIEKIAGIKTWPLKYNSQMSKTKILIINHVLKDHLANRDSLYNKKGLRSKRSSKIDIYKKFSWISWKNLKIQKFRMQINSSKRSSKIDINKKISWISWRSLKIQNYKIQGNSSKI
jgi:hypothetical protein